jgi:hypothetical protein
MLLLTLVYTKYLISIGGSASQFFPLRRSEIINIGNRPRFRQFVLKIKSNVSKYRRISASQHGVITQVQKYGYYYYFIGMKFFVLI